MPWAHTWFSETSLERDTMAAITIANPRVRVRLCVCLCVCVCVCVCLLRAVVPIVCYTWVLVRKANRTNSHLVPSAVSLRITGAEHLHQVKRMIGGIGHVLFWTYSQTLNGHWNVHCLN